MCEQFEAEILPLDHGVEEDCECGNMADHVAVLGDVRVLCCRALACELQAKEDALEQYLDR